MFNKYRLVEWYLIKWKKMSWKHTELPGIHFPATPPHRLIDSGNLSIYLHIELIQFFLLMYTSTQLAIKNTFFRLFLLLYFLFHAGGVN